MSAFDDHVSPRQLHVEKSSGGPKDFDQITICRTLRRSVHDVIFRYFLVYPSCRLSLGSNADDQIELGNRVSCLLRARANDLG